MSKVIAEIDAEMGDTDADSLESSCAEMTEYGNVGRAEYLNAAQSFEQRTEAMDLTIESSGRKVAQQFCTGNSATENEVEEREQASDNNLPKKEPENIEPSKMFEDILNFLRILALILGIRISYDWIPRKYFLYWVSIVSLFFGFCILIYTAHLHYTNENYMRMLEPAAISGTLISVKQTFNFKILIS